MTVVPLTQISGASTSGADAAPDVDAPQMLGVGSGPGAAGLLNVFAGALADASEALARADRSERSFAHGTGGLQAMVLDRAQADVALSIATTAASRTTQTLSTILGMQV